MTIALYYNPGNQFIREDDDSDSVQRRLGEQGYRKVDRFELVAMYNPALNVHKTVMRAEVPTWQNQGYYAEPTVVYHPEEGSRTVSGDQAADMLTCGWYDSPAKFPTSSLVSMSGAPLAMPSDAADETEAPAKKPAAKK